MEIMSDVDLCAALYACNVWMLPASRFGMKDRLILRLAYVDFDGDAAFEKPTSLDTYPRIVSGIRAILQFLDPLKANVRTPPVLETEAKGESGISIPGSTSPPQEWHNAYE